MDVSVIIVNYNTKQLLADCLQSLYQHTYGVGFEVIVVDNASIDGSVQMVESDYPDVILLKSSQNLGFGRANNVACSRACGRYLFLLNPDTILLNNAIKLFYDFAENNIDKPVFLGSILLDEHNLPTHSYGKFPTLRGTLLIALNTYTSFIGTNFIRNEEEIPSITSEYLNVDYITGADLFVLKSVFETCGRFDERFFMYFEETDLQLNAAKHGYKRMLIDTPKIVHYYSASFESVSKKSFSKMMIVTKSLFLFLKKHNNPFKYYTFRCLYAILRFLPAIMHPYSSKEKMRYINLLFFGR